jgi:hypothetical protein
MAGDPIFEMEFGKMAGEDDTDNEEIVVQLPAAAGDGAIVKKAEQAAPAAADPVADLKKQFGELQQRTSVAERAAQEATQTAHQATQRAQSAETALVGSQLDTVMSGIAAAEAEAESAEREYIAASEAGDFAAQARAQRKISGAEARKLRLEEAKSDLEDAAKRQPAPRREAPAARPVPPADPVERFLTERGIKGRSADWIRQHPNVVTDPRANARMMAAHNLAIADDVESESDEYFRRIEEGIKPVTKQAAAAPAGGDGRRPSSAAAPASGAAGGLSGGTEVRLTKREATSATDGTLVWNYPDPTGQNRWKVGDPIGLAEMARRKYEGQRAGLYDKSATEA